MKNGELKMENVAILARYRNFPFSIINSQLLLTVGRDDSARPTESCSYMDRNYLFSSANFFMKSMSFSTPSIGIAL